MKFKQVRSLQEIVDRHVHSPQDRREAFRILEREESILASRSHRYQQMQAERDSWVSMDRLYETA